MCSQVQKFLKIQIIQGASILRQDLMLTNVKTIIELFYLVSYPGYIFLGSGCIAQRPEIFFHCLYSPDVC